MNGFEIIEPDTLDTQGLLDPSDESLNFVRRRSDNTRPKPVAIYRIENEFLLCYDGACRVVFVRMRDGTDLRSIEFARKQKVEDHINFLKVTSIVAGVGHGRTS